MKEIYSELTAMASELLKVPKEKITLNTLIMEELRADSLDVVELLAMIEDKYGIYIPDSELVNMRTVGEVVAYVEENLP